MVRPLALASLVAFLVASGEAHPAAPPRTGAARPPAPARSGTLRPPLARPGRAISEFGMRRGKLHAGIDLKAPQGTPVCAVADGVVRRAGWVGGYGWVVYLEHGNRWQSRYAHLVGAPRVKVGQRLVAGTVLGAVGASGNATTAHLHFELRDPSGAPRDPRGRAPV